MSTILLYIFWPVCPPSRARACKINMNKSERIRGNLKVSLAYKLQPFHRRVRTVRASGVLGDPAVLPTAILYEL